MFADVKPAAEQAMPFEKMYPYPAELLNISKPKRVAPKGYEHLPVARMVSR